MLGAVRERAGWFPSRQKSVVDLICWLFVTEQLESPDPGYYVAYVSGNREEGSMAISPVGVAVD